MVAPYVKFNTLTNQAEVGPTLRLTGTGTASPFTPVLTNVVGLTATGTGSGCWMTAGDVVMLSMVFVGTDSPGGGVAGDIAIPVPRAASFVTALASGSGTVQHSGGAAYNFQISALPGSQSLRLSSVVASPAWAGANIAIVCHYRLTP